MEQLLERFRIEIIEGGVAYGAFENECFIGFSVLGQKLRGKNKDRPQIDLMYTIKNFRRKGIGKQLMNELSKEALNRGAKFLYISSAETESAVNFYKNFGSELTDEIDQEPFDLEPNDIHMLKRL